jgi:hypothetical protein
MIMSDASQPLDGEDLINYGDVTARINYLKTYDCHRPDRADFPCANFHACPTCNDGGKELEDLRSLAASMAEVNRYAGRASAIRDSYAETFVRDELEGIYGEEVFATLETYIDWSTLTGDRAAEMEEVTFRGTTYYITS